MRDIDLVIFDCDGVVVDSEVLSCQCLADIYGRYDLPISLDEVFDRFLGRSFPAVQAYYSERTGHPLPEAFRIDYRAHLLMTFRAKLKPMPAIETVLERLELPFCLASSSDPERIETTLAAAGLAGYFSDRVYDATMVARGKPAPDLFLFAAAQMGVPARRSLVVEDTVPGVLAAKAAGMQVWGFEGGSHCVGRNVGRQLTQAGADRVFGSMADFMSNSDRR